jgi:predicted GNAT family N-acyltransferase
MFFKIIEYNSPEYQQMVDLRLQILRIPLGLTFTEEQLSLDKTDILLGSFDEKENLIKACCILSEVDSHTIKLRQMAVSDNFQGKGLGRQLIAFAEKVSKERGFKKIVLNARKSVEGFYQKLGYTIVGNEFIEVTIPHYKMEKTIG